MTKHLPSESVQTLEQTIEYRFQNEKLLLTALTHRSAAKKNTHDHYEKFEYLGDAVLDLAIAHMLITKHPDYNEGQLSKLRAALVNAEALAAIAKKLDLGKLLVLSNSEQKSGGAEKNSILADVLESILGAIYLESGFEAAYKVVEKLFDGLAISVTPKDPKTELQEILHTLAKPPPEYILDKCEGPIHAPMFITSVAIDGKVLGQGSGKSKKIAQQAAALEALKFLRKAD